MYIIAISYSSCEEHWPLLASFFWLIPIYMSKHQRHISTTSVCVCVCGSLYALSYCWILYQTEIDLHNSNTSKLISIYSNSPGPNGSFGWPKNWDVWRRPKLLQAFERHIANTCCGRFCLNISKKTIFFIPQLGRLRNTVIRVESLVRNFKVEVEVAV